MPTLAQIVNSRNQRFLQLQSDIDQRMSTIFWHIPARGSYKESPDFYEAVKTPEQTLETLNDLRQVSSHEFEMHRTIYVRGVIAAIAWHDWKPSHVQELMYVGTWFTMFKKELNSPNYTAQLKTLLNVIKRKVNPLVERAPLELQSRWQFMQNYWDNQFVNKKITPVQNVQDEYSLA